MSPTSREFASPAYKYIEDQMNAVTGHRMPITYEFDQTLGRNQNVPILNWEQPQFAPDPGIGKFNEGFSPIKETLYKYNPWKFKPQEFESGEELEILVTSDAPNSSNGIAVYATKIRSDLTRDANLAGAQIEGSLIMNIIGAP